MPENVKGEIKARTNGKELKLQTMRLMQNMKQIEMVFVACHGSAEGACHRASLTSSEK
jgi:hypothetical protein